MVIIFSHFADFKAVGVQHTVMRRRRTQVFVALLAVLALLVVACQSCLGHVRVVLSVQVILIIALELGDHIVVVVYVVGTRVTETRTVLILLALIRFGQRWLRRQHVMLALRLLLLPVTPRILLAIAVVRPG